MPAAVERDRRYTWEEYLAIEAAAGDGERYEYWDGEVRPVHGYHADGVTAMAGAEPEHNQLKDNISRELGNRLTRRGCRVLSSDQRVAVSERRFVYPDVVVACAPEYDDARPRRLLNPDLVVEVLSPSTADADIGPKLGRYTAVPSVREVWIADPGRPLVYQFFRPAAEGDDWRMRATTALDADLRCEAFGIDVAMADLYALVLDGDQADAG